VKQPNKEPVYSIEFDQLFEAEFTNVFVHEEFYHLFSTKEIFQIKQQVKRVVFENTVDNVVNWKAVREILCKSDKVIVQTELYDITRYVGIDTLGIPVYYGDTFEALRDGPFGYTVIGLTDDAKHLEEAIAEIKKAEEFL
jgi:hypothetical protein